jgi:hypothetical protein
MLKSHLFAILSVFSNALGTSEKRSTISLAVFK